MCAMRIYSIVQEKLIPSSYFYFSSSWLQIMFSSNYDKFYFSSKKNKNFHFPSLSLSPLFEQIRLEKQKRREYFFSKIMNHRKYTGRSVGIFTHSLLLLTVLVPVHWCTSTIIIVSYKKKQFLKYRNKIEIWYHTVSYHIIIIA